MVNVSLLVDIFTDSFNEHTDPGDSCGDVYCFHRATQEDQRLSRLSEAERQEPTDTLAGFLTCSFLFSHCVGDPDCTGMHSRQALESMQTEVGSYY